MLWEQIVIECDRVQPICLTEIKTKPRLIQTGGLFCDGIAADYQAKHPFLNEGRCVYLAKPLPSTAPLPPLPLIKGLLPV